jgi:class 3 adenylate cyclase
MRSSPATAALAHWALSGRAGSSIGQLFAPVRQWLDSALPQGEVTFLLGDAIGSTQLWEQDAEAAAEAVELMERTVAKAVERNGGFLPRDQGEGDSFFAVFADAADAVSGAISIRSRLSGSTLPVRIALHTGRAQLRSGNYFGVEVNRCARIRRLANGCQILLSRSTIEAFRGGLSPAAPGVEIEPLGFHNLRDLSEPVEVFAVVPAIERRPA